LFSVFVLTNKFDLIWFDDERRQFVPNRRAGASDASSISEIG